MRIAAAPLCEARCAMRDRHIADCTDHDACRGCLPRQALDGLRLCIVHLERLKEDAEQAPSLYADLGQVLIRTGVNGEKMSGSSSGAPIPDEDVIDARGCIRSALIQMVKAITYERGVSAPTIVVAGKTYAATQPAALGPFVVRHGDWLAAHRHAGRFADIMHAATHGDAYRLAYPSRRDRLYIGDCPIVVRNIDGTERVCGTRLYQSPNDPLIRCNGCGADETIEQWQRWIVTDAGGRTDAYAIAAHLAMQWMREVDPALIRQWSHRGHIHPVMEPDPTDIVNGQRWRTVADERGRVQYDVEAVVAYAESLWGKPARR